MISDTSKIKRCGAGQLNKCEQQAVCSLSQPSGFSGYIELFFHLHRDKLYMVHIVMFLAFSVILFLPLFLTDPPESSTPLTHFTSFANYVLWGLWFPLVLLSVVFSGRSWCGLLCPMGAASEFANKHGLQRTIPAWVRWEGAPVVSFILVTVWGQTVGVRDHPEAIAVVFGSTMVAAIGIGFLFGKNKRAWCRHMCPIGLLLGVFSRLGIVNFAPKLKKPVHDRYTDKGLCPTMIKISTKDESRHCIECFRCVNPNSRGGLRLEFRPPAREIETIEKHHPNIAEVWFLFLATGIVLGGFLWISHPSYHYFREAVGNWMLGAGIYGFFESGPSWLMSVHPERREVFSWLDFSTISLYMLFCMAFIAGALAGGTWFSALLLSDKEKARSIFIRLGYQFMPVALVSIVVGLGGALFEVFSFAGVGASSIAGFKMAFLLTGLIWSLKIGVKLVLNTGATGMTSFLSLIPTSFCSLLLGFLWWIAIF